MKKLFLTFSILLLFSSTAFCYTVRIEVHFEENTSKGKYADSLYFSESEWNLMTKKQKDDKIAEKKKERIDNWLTEIDKPFVEPIYTDEEIQTQLDELKRQKEEWESKLAQ